jgi:hypothetical protein
MYSGSIPILGFVVLILKIIVKLFVSYDGTSLIE